MRFARIDSRESFAIETPIFIARQADSHGSLEFPIRANHPIQPNRANRFARITPLSLYRMGGRRRSLLRRQPREDLHNLAKDLLELLHLRVEARDSQRGEYGSKTQKS